MLGLNWEVRNSQKTVLEMFFCTEDSIPVHFIQCLQSGVVQEADISEKATSKNRRWTHHTNLWTICEVGIPPLLMFLHCGFSISPILRRPLSASRRSSSFNISKFLLCFNFLSSEQLVKGVIRKILELTISKILSIVCYLELFEVQDDIVSNWTGSTVFSDRPPMLILPIKEICASHLHLK